MFDIVTANSTKNSNGFSEKRRINRLLLCCWAVIVIVLISAYSIEILKGTKEITYVLIMCVTSIPFMLWALLVYRSDPEKSYIKYIVSGSYLVMYAFILLTGDTPLVFTYILPFYSALVASNDKKLLRNVGIASILLNVVDVVIDLINDDGSDISLLADCEIQLAALILITVFSIVSCSLVSKMNANKVEAMKETAEAQERLNASIMNLISLVENNVSVIGNASEEMSDSAKLTVEAMENVKSGSDDTSVALEVQAVATKEIQQLITKQTDLSKNIKMLVGRVKADIDSSVDNIRSLDITSRQAKENNELVKNNMQELNDETEEMKNIISIISGIATKTNMLALNASIEAARAGEAGRSFAVVAKEITELANQTKIATENISKLVEELRSQSGSAYDAVNMMIDISNTQNEDINEVNKMFGLMYENINNIVSDVDNQEQQIREISNSSVKITDGTNEIIEINDRLKNYAESTDDMTKRHLERTLEMDRMVNDVISEIESFKKENP